MISRSDHKVLRYGRAAAAITLVGAIVVGGAAVTGATGDNNGRDGSVRPGTPTDQSSRPAPGSLDAGRSGAPRSAPVAGGQSTTATQSPVDNGRGRPDPAAGPNRVPAASSDAPRAADETAAFDTDSGLAPAPRSSSGTQRPAPAEPPVDQDVPGAPTGVERPAPGAAPVDDQDG